MNSKPYSISRQRSAVPMPKIAWSLLVFSMFISAHAYGQYVYPPLDFGTVDVGKTTQLDLKYFDDNPGICFQFSGFVLTGQNPGDFKIVGNTCDDGCLHTPFTCTVSVAFTPGDEGPRTAELEIFLTCSYDDGSPCTVAGGNPAIQPLKGNVDVSVTAQPPNAALITVNVDTVTLLIEGLGPSLGGVADPVLEVRDGIQNLIGLNNDWKDTQASTISGTGHAPSNLLESAVLLDLTKGTYTVTEEGNCGNKGTGEIAVYEISPHKLDTPVATSAPTTTGIDTDLDALPDEWEKSGMSVVTNTSDEDVCYPGDVRALAPDGKFVALNKMGANPTKKDIFVHADWMSGGTPYDLKPTDFAMLRVIDAFALEGINLHIDVGPESVLLDGVGGVWGDLSQAHAIGFSPATGSWDPTFTTLSLGELELIKATVDSSGHGFLASGREKTFHYALFANAVGCEFCRVIGAATTPGNELLLGLGSLAKRSYYGAPMPFSIIEMDQSTIFMHELGHNLGLRHGGLDDVQDKPNYLSLMNYLFTPNGVLNSDGTRSFDYSRVQLPTLGEDQLDEGIGIQDPALHRTLWFTEKQPSVEKCPASPPPFNPPDYAYNALFLPSAQLDWDQDTKIDVDRVAVDINGSGSTDPALIGFDDWSALAFTGDGTIGVPKSQSNKAWRSNVAPMDDMLSEPSIDEVLPALPKYLFDEEINAPEDIVVVSPQTGAAPLTVNFDGTGSTAVTGTIVDWSWDFGDGSTGSGPTVTHVYQAVGDYYAKLKVTDSNDRINLVPLLYHVVAAAPTARLANISTRLNIGTGDNVLIGGFIITGTDNKNVIIRAIGPSLPVSGKIADPILELHDASGAVLATNDNWGDAPNKQAIIETTIPPSNDLESALIASLPANNAAYTVIVRGVNDTTGVGLVEAYDLDSSANSQLANISTRGLVQTGDNVMIGGFIVTGNTDNKVIVRAIGPSLPVTGPLADPTLELFDANGASLGFNDNWRSDQEAEIIATTVPPTNDLESALVQTLAPAPYTAIVRGVNNTAGVALVEAYDLQ